MFPTSDRAGAHANIEPKDEPSRRPNHPDGPWPDIEQVVAQVNEPMLAAAQVNGNKLRIQFSGKPRVGTTHTFMELWRSEPGRPTDVVLEEVTAITPTPETASSTYLFTYTSDNTDALKAFAASLIAKFEKRVVGLPSPVDDQEIGMSVEVTPDNPDQLSSVLAKFRSFAESRASNRLINVRALVGRRLFKYGADGKSLVAYASLDFVLGFPDELANYVDELKSAVKGLEVERGLGENWDVSLGHYSGGVIDVATGKFEQLGEEAETVNRGE